ncbi:hypothetical protein IFM89_026640 [Coptis chinensis]|uniref:Uncharacterized protein n=1 Tax=Coptis chinensis TaxID=261450 RepID=A0A835H139_9MAGN|nr:hypothetical protein IFM89_026640 [Coptis chinensis]
MVRQRYHVPPSWLNPSGNLLIIFEEWGGDPNGISLKISSIKFASLGTPQGVCGSFKEGSCHAHKSYDAFEKKIAMLGGALTGAIIFVGTNSSRDKVVMDAIAGGTNKAIIASSDIIIAPELSSHFPLLDGIGIDTYITLKPLEEGRFSQHELFTEAFHVAIVLFRQCSRLTGLKLMQCYLEIVDLVHSPETLQGAVKAINKRILSVLNSWESSKVDLGMLCALLSPICSGPPEQRKRTVLDALLWRYVGEGSSVVKKVDAMRYIELLRAVYLPSQSTHRTSEFYGEVDVSTVSFPKFL